MISHSLPIVRNLGISRAPRHSPNPTCTICKQPVSLENAKTDELGLAIHEQCYVLKLRPPASIGRQKGRSAL